VPMSTDSDGASLSAAGWCSAPGAACDPAGGGGGGPDFDAEQRGQFFAQPAHADAQRLHPEAAAVRAHDGPRLAAARAAQHLLVFGAGHRCATARALGQLTAVGAREQPCAAGAVVDADQRAARGRRRIVEHRSGEPDEFLGEHSAARIGTAAVHDFEGGPPRAFVVGREGDGLEVAECRHRDRGDR
jgi:hypothetical protein